MNYKIAFNAWFQRLGCFSLAIACLNSQSMALDVQIAEAPTNNLELTVGAIRSAKHTILLNIYELTSPEIVDAIDAQIKAGVKIVILEEGSPVGGLSTTAKGVQSQIAQAMQGLSGDHLYEMTASAGGTRRFNFDHGKYAVIDDAAVLIGSENYSPSGNPTAGSIGNRGWEVFIQDPSLASDFKKTFVSDIDMSFKDVIEITHNSGFVSEQIGSVFSELNFPTPRTSHHPKPTPTPKPTPSTTPVPTPNPSVTPSNEPTPPTNETAGTVPGFSVYQSTNIEKITSPDSGVSGILNAIQAAKVSIDIEQMTFDSAWNGASSSPIYDAVIAAATKRGVKVRVLLNDEHVFDHPGHPAKPTNHTTVAQLNQISNNISARIANLKAMGVDYIHNKGMLIDGNQTLISSINWDENSFEKNREAAVLISSGDINRHYQTLFQSDWNASSSPSNISNRSTLPSNLSSQSLDFNMTNCPNKLSIHLAIGEIKIDDHSDEDMLAIQNKSYAGDYLKSNDTRVCVYNAAGAIERTIGKSFLELKSTKTGTLSIIFEGYTPKTGKLFSVRTKPDGTELLGKHQAQVYDSSSPSRELIGSAELEIKSGQ